MGYHNRESSFSDRGGYKNEEFNQTGSFSRSSKQGTGRDSNHIGYRSRGTAPPKRGTIIEEPGPEYNNQRNAFSDIQHTNNNQRMLNSPRVERKSYMDQDKYNDSNYNFEYEKDISNNWNGDESYNSEASKPNMYLENDEFQEQSDYNEITRKYKDNSSKIVENKQNIDTGTYTKKSH